MWLPISVLSSAHAAKCVTEQAGRCASPAQQQGPHGQACQGILNSSVVKKQTNVLGEANKERVSLLQCIPLPRNAVEVKDEPGASWLAAPLPGEHREHQSCQHHRAPPAGEGAQCSIGLSSSKYFSKFNKSSLFLVRLSGETNKRKTSKELTFYFLLVFYILQALEGFC